MFKLSPFKALTDDQAASVDNGARFAALFTDTNKEMLQNLRAGIVVPQQSLRSSIKAVFKKTPGLHPSMAMSPFEVGQADGTFGLLLVDETHRLNQRANQPSGVLNAKFTTITRELFGGDGFSKTQLDWIRAKSRHQIFLVALPAPDADARACGIRLYVVRPLDSRAPADASRLRGIFQRDAEVGLSRMVAGYAWEWRTKRDRTAFDIVIGHTQLRWNSTPTDWMSSRNALEEMGSNHTVHGYDLNYLCRSHYKAGPAIRPRAATSLHQSRLVL
ncbi:hypothetical protein B0J15DRAFT_579857 [Fusarium solani]|uniref:Schlafen group 3-like DNA/RNA helicase domain-containing protein n=1 Tax=Fusarium solani TaxID=169388 RepID=A0A9P9HYJ1_FUSSL|nr:uncharacterized protein B0J15DRAFT_579857 [Fusarium solani]KAH7265895.1 hypothetical protein B0J15DRAFT_579857 [Fusarium solani]